MVKYARSMTIAIAMMMAVTCFAAAPEIAFASETGAGQTDETTQAPTTTAKPKDPYAAKKKTGWVTIKGKKYYYKKGKRLKGVKKVKGTWYRFGKFTGALKFRIGDGMDKKAQKYRSRTKKLILVSYSKHRVRIYTGKKNKWKRKKNFKCTLGASSTPTPRGTFTIGSRGRYFNTGSNARCWYWTGFIGTTYLFHSVIYNRNSSPNHIIDGRLGINASHGCIRLKLNNARWIYNNVPRGTKVVIY